MKQRGEGRLGCVFWLALVLVFGVVTSKFLPVKIASSRLEDFMVEQAKFAQNSSDARIRKRILERAEELELPVIGRDIEVRKTAARILMRCRYTVPLKFPYYTYEWDIDLDVERPIYIF